MGLVRVSRLWEEMHVFYLAYLQSGLLLLREKWDAITVSMYVCM